MCVLAALLQHSDHLLNVFSVPRTRTIDGRGDLMTMMAVAFRRPARFLIDFSGFLWSQEVSVLGSVAGQVHRP